MKAKGHNFSRMCDNKIKTAILKKIDVHRACGAFTFTGECSQEEKQAPVK